MRSSRHIVKKDRPIQMDYKNCNQVIEGEDLSPLSKARFSSSLEKILEHEPLPKIVDNLHLDKLFSFHLNSKAENLILAARLRLNFYFEVNSDECLKILKGEGEYFSQGDIRQKLFIALIGLYTSKDSEQVSQLVEKLLLNSVVELDQMFMDGWSDLDAIYVCVLTISISNHRDIDTIELSDAQNEALGKMARWIVALCDDNREIIPEIISNFDVDIQPNLPLFFLHRYIKGSNSRKLHIDIGDIDPRVLIEAIKCWTQMEDKELVAHWVQENMEAIVSLENRSPGVCKTLMLEYGIITPARYPEEILLNQAGYSECDRIYQDPKRRNINRIDIKNANVPISIAYSLIVVAQADWSNSFSSWKEEFLCWQEQLKDFHQFVFIEAGNVDDLALRAAFVAEQRGRLADGLHLFAHGDKNGATLGIDDDDKSELLVKDIGHSNLAMMMLKETLSPNVNIVIHSCSSAQGLVCRLKKFLGPRARISGFSGADYFSLSEPVVEWSDNKPSVAWKLRTMSGKSVTRETVMR